MKENLKLIFAYLAYICLYCFRFFPVNRKKVMFLCYDGKQVADSPYYIYLHLLKNNPYLHFVWGVSPVAKYEKQNGTLYVNRRSLAFFYHIMTCSVFITNCGHLLYIPFRKQQCSIDTWHGGGAYKLMKTPAKNFWKNNWKIKMQCLNYTISCNKRFTQIVRDTNWEGNRNFLEIGMPRNDILFNKNEMQIQNQTLRKQFQLSMTDHVVLYAPTFRGNYQNPDKFDFSIDIARVKKSFQKRFQRNVKFLFRGHHAFTESLKKDEIDLNVSNYPFMQNLLCMTDALITDYSSSMWDFAQTGKPGFLFTPDISEYIENRGLYTSIDTWAYPYATNMDDFCHLVDTYDRESSLRKIQSHLDYLGSFEDGQATQKICNLISEYLGKNK